jgi:hypothetical protein
MEKLIFEKREADIRHFAFFAVAEYQQKLLPEN